MRFTDQELEFMHSELAAAAEMSYDAIASPGLNQDRVKERPSLFESVLNKITNEQIRRERIKKKKELIAQIEKQTGQPFSKWDRFGEAQELFKQYTKV